MDLRLQQILILNEFTTLPIVISDYDADRTPKPALAARKTESGSWPIAFSSSSATSPDFAWSTGFSTFADEMWNSMTTSMKHQLREACYQVLKRTDNRKVDYAQSEYYDDARFLD